VLIPVTSESYKRFASAQQDMTTGATQKPDHPLGKGKTEEVELSTTVGLGIVIYDRKAHMNAHICNRI